MVTGSTQHQVKNFVIIVPMATIGGMAGPVLLNWHWQSYLNSLVKQRVIRISSGNILLDYQLMKTLKLLLNCSNKISVYFVSLQYEETGLHTMPLCLEYKFMARHKS